MGPVLIDTSVIIGVLRQHSSAMALARKVQGWPKSVTEFVIAEVLAGARDKREFHALLAHMRDHFQWLPRNDREQAVFLDILLRHGPHKGVHIVDYHIASAAIAHGIPLLTLNRKHVSFIEGLELI